MKPRLLSTARLSFPLAAALAALISAQSAQAVDSYWDPALTTTITGTGAGGGIWLSTTANWVTTAGTNVVLPTANRASFGGAAGGVVAVGGPNSVAGMIFNTTGYTLSAASAQTITSTAGVTLASGVVATIGSNVTFTRSTADVITGSGGVLNIGAVGGDSTGAQYVGTQSGSTGSTRTITINGGATVSVNNGGYFGQSTGTVYNTLVNPNGTAILLGDNTNSGTMTVASGGTVTVGNNTVLSVGNGTAASGTLNIYGQVNAGVVTTGTSGSLPAQSAYAGLRFGSGTMTAGTRTATLFTGGVLKVGQVYASSATAGTSVNTFNFNGGTLQASIGNTTFMQGLTAVNVQADGAKIDSNNFNITIGQSLLAGAPSGGLTKSGGGTLTLSGTNTYTGGTTITGGTLQVTTLAAGGSNSSIGSSGTNAAAGSAATDLVIDGGILRYAGTTAATTNRLFTIGTGGATLDASGTTTGTLGFTGTGSLAFSSSAAPASLTLTGTGTGTAGAGSLASVIGNSGSGANITSLNKTSSGTWTLTGLNTYTGATTISGGTLKLSGTGKLGYTSGTSGNYGGDMSIDNGAIFENASSGSQTLSGAITGAGTLTNSGGGGLTLSNAGNSFAALSISNAGSRVFINHATALHADATVNIVSGALVFGAADTRGNAITVASGGTLTARAATTLSNVTLPGSGSVIFNNDDQSTNSLTINNGQTLTGELTVQVGGARMLVSGGSIGTVDLSGDIDGEGSLVMTSSGNVSNSNNKTGKLTLSGTNTYTGATLVSSGTLFVTGSLTSDVSVSDAATLGGGGTVAAVSFAGGSYFDIALAVGGNALDSTTTISFASAGFGIDNLRYNGAAVDWSSIGDNTYTLISGDFTETNLGNFGSANAFDIGGGRSAYFTEGSLQLVVIPEPRAALLGGLGLLALLRRRRA